MAWGEGYLLCQGKILGTGKGDVEDAKQVHSHCVLSVCLALTDTVCWVFTITL